jgi:hypothetical protein
VVETLAGFYRTRSCMLEASALQPAAICVGHCTKAARDLSGGMGPCLSGIPPSWLAESLCHCLR